MALNWMSLCSDEREIRTICGFLDSQANRSGWTTSSVSERTEGKGEGGMEGGGVMLNFTMKACLVSYLRHRLCTHACSTRFLLNQAYATQCFDYQGSLCVCLNSLLKQNLHLYKQMTIAYPHTLPPSQQYETKAGYKASRLLLPPSMTSSLN